MIEVDEEFLKISNISLPGFCNWRICQKCQVAAVLAQFLTHTFYEICVFNTNTFQILIN